MKLWKIGFVTFFSLSVAATAYSAPTLVCALKTLNGSKMVSVTVDFAKPIEEYYISESLKIGRQAFSFNLNVSQTKKKITIDAVFDENMIVQDEIGSQSWTVDLDQVKRGKPVLVEALTMDSKHILNFVCYYNAVENCDEPVKKKKN